MKLFYSPFHDFIHKSLVVIAERGLDELVTYVPTFPFRNLQRERVGHLYDLSPIAPLAKVPVLALDDGSVLYGSQVIAEYLDSMGRAGARLYPDKGPQRWDALRRLALGDTIFDLSVQMSMENWIPAGERRTNLFEWLWPKIVRSFDSLEAEADRFAGFDIGHVGLLQGISYCEAWSRGNESDPVNPLFDWRAGRLRLAGWYDAATSRPSVRSHHKQAYDGDSSPDFFQAQLNEVLAARKANGLP